MEKNNQSNLFIISGPSGAGEDSIIAGLAKIMPIERVITTTTRRPRPGESQGRPYYFISQQEFKNKIAAGEFFEYAQEYNNHYYGVTVAEINRVRASGKIGIWKIEYKGVQTAKKLMPGIIAILITAPLKSLERRLRRRDRAGEEFIQQRMAYTKEWLKHKDIYDYEVKNLDGRLNEAVQAVAKIIKKHSSLLPPAA